MKYYETIVVGAGPCGLAAAIELTQNDMEYLVIEAGNIVNAIYNYPTHQTFFSSSEKLAIGKFPFITEAHKPKRNQALVYYREVVKHFGLNINAYEKVTSSRKIEDGFTVETRKGQYMCKYLIIATGYYGQPNKLDVPGADKDKVFHYFKEAHPFFNQNVLVIGGKNSSVDAAIELEKAGSHVTMIYRGEDYSKSIKPWILPQLKSLIRYGKINHYFNAEIIDIKNHSVIFSTDDGTVEIKNDFVFAMIGYHPDHRLLKSLGIDLEEGKNGLSPVHDPETMETNIDDLYIAGVIAAGDDANMIIIENGRFHGGRIIKDILKKKAQK